MPTSRVSTPWSASAFSSVRPVSSMARRSTDWAPARSSSVRGGSFHGDALAAGPSAISSCSGEASSSSGTSTFGALRRLAPAGLPSGPVASSGGSTSVSSSGTRAGSMTSVGEPSSKGSRNRVARRWLTPAVNGRTPATVRSAATRSGVRVSTTSPATATSTRTATVPPVPRADSIGVPTAAPR